MRLIKLELKENRLSSVEMEVKIGSSFGVSDSGWVKRKSGYWAKVNRNCPVQIQIGSIWEVGQHELKEEQ